MSGEWRETMTPRQRVLEVLAGRVPDRVPVVLGASNATGVKMRTYERLRGLCGLCGPRGGAREEQYMYAWPELGTALAEEEVLRRLHVDVRPVHDREPESVLRRMRERDPHSPYINSWGSGATEVGPDDWVPNVHPLRDATSAADVESYAGWPDMHDLTRYAGVAQRVRELRADGTYASMGTPWLAFPLERAFAMQGMDRFLENMAGAPDLAKALLRKTTDKCLELMGHFLDEAGHDGLDLVKIGDDLGTQTSLLMSPAMYRRMLKPLHAELVALIKRRSSARVFFHTDGDVLPLVNDFIEIGIDVLNPIQTSAGKMSDLAQVRSRTAGKLVLCGAVDTHRVLPTGTPEEVRAEVRRVVKALGEHGGYMLSSVHTVMNDVPAENVLAMVDEVVSCGRYPLSY
eukprot:m51a1_g3605 putative uroporphyrinogen-iii decarboxylase (402) ;mRNA; r:32344-33891